MRGAVRYVDRIAELRNPREAGAPLKYLYVRASALHFILYDRCNAVVIAVTYIKMLLLIIISYYLTFTTGILGGVVIP